jgi:Xaa-Pro aminopeptidase
MQDSLNKLRTWIAEQGIDVFMVTQPQNRSYVTGWLNDDQEGSGIAFVSQQELILLTNSLYREVAGAEAPDWQVVVPPPESREYAAVIATLAQEHGWQKIGFEAAFMTVAAYDKLRAAGENVFTLQAFEKSYVNELRKVKQERELELLRKAIAITDETFTHIRQWIQPGMTEQQVKWEILRTMVELGAEGPSFDPIVASGPNGTMPHAVPGQRRIQRGELITIDIGARYQGYCADMTRTICLGEPREPRMREVYDAVLKAMKTCEAGLYGGIQGKAADALARDVLEEAGLAEYYIHSTGHGVGLQIHEGPGLSKLAPDDALLPVGTVVTVEPGVYIPNWTGTRVEDCVLITEQGCEVLTQSPTELVLPR